MENIFLRIFVMIVRVIAVIIRSLSIATLFVSGLLVLVLAFIDQPPWYSSLMVIMGFAAIFIGDWLADNEIPDEVVYASALVMRIAVVSIAFSAGAVLLCMAFIDQPPWHSVVQLLFGASMMYASKAYLESDFSFCSWWKEISESVG